MARCTVLVLLPLLLAVWAGALCGTLEAAPSAGPTSVSDAMPFPGDQSLGVQVQEPPYVLLEDQPPGVQVQEPAIVLLEDQPPGVQVQPNSVSSEIEDGAQSAEMGHKVPNFDDLLKVLDCLQDAESKLEDCFEDADLDSMLNLEGAQSQPDSRLPEAPTNSEFQLAEVRRRLRDCSDLPADARGGVRLLAPGLWESMPAFCDQETDGGGWTVIQRRADIQPRQNFYRGWEDYKRGFGELDGEFWWGLENLWLVTCQPDRQYEIRFDLEDFDGAKRYAVYQDFRIASEEEGYRLTAADYEGNAGDSFGYHSGKPFATKDSDWDVNSCAKAYGGAWWYGNCHHSNLNGRYLYGYHMSPADGVNWLDWRGYHYSLKAVEMKIRPSKKM